MPKPLVQSTGRRKEAVARAQVRPGTGQFLINGKSLEVYFPTAVSQMVVSEALTLTDTREQYDVTATIEGGGISGQAGALRLALGDDVAAGVAVSSTKSMHGHCLGAAGGVEGALTAMVIREGVIPPTINLQDLDPACVGVDHVANTARTADVRIAMSSAFGFGGHNAILVLGRLEDA